MQYKTNLLFHMQLEILGHPGRSWKLGGTFMVVTESGTDSVLLQVLDTTLQSIKLPFFPPSGRVRSQPTRLPECLSS